MVFVCRSLVLVCLSTCLFLSVSSAQVTPPGSSQVNGIPSNATTGGSASFGMPPLIPPAVTSLIQSTLQNIFWFRSDKNSTLTKAIRVDRVFDPVENTEVPNTGSAVNFRVKNIGAKVRDYFVPFNTEPEWAAFLQNKPADVLVCNADGATQNTILTVQAGGFSAAVLGCTNCLTFMNQACTQNNQCGDGGFCNFLPLQYSGVMTRSICDGLAMNITQPTAFTPPALGMIAGVPETVHYQGQTFPLNTGGNVKYIVRQNGQLDAQAIATATGYEAEWMAYSCTAILQTPAWDPGVYPTSYPQSFWSRAAFVACLNNTTPLPTGAVARAWNLETAQCEAIYPTLSNNGTCGCSGAATYCPAFGQSYPGRHVCGTNMGGGQYTEKGLAWGTAGDGTTPMLFNPINTAGLVNATYQTFVTYNSLPAYAGGSVKYITSPSKVGLVSQYSCFEVEAFSDCWDGNLLPPPYVPDWDPGIYTVMMQNGKNLGYQSFWDREDFLNCIYANDLIVAPTFTNPQAIAFVWNLETDQCEEFIPGM